MFIKNKYFNTYYNIINRAKSRDLDKSVYTEKHHIVPRSMGGSNKKENLVKLTAREHFVVHLLLPKFTEGKSRSKMVWARWRMCIAPKKEYKLKSRTYETSKIMLVTMMRGRKTGRTSKDFDDEWKKNLSLGSKGKCAGEKNGMYGQIGKNTGKKVYNNGTQEYYFIPGKQTPGFVPGRIPGGTIGNKKGLRWYNNGVITKQFREGLQPEGFVNGRIRK